MSKLAIGDKMPNFSVASTTGTFNLQNHTGSFIVLYFYPKDDTPGCTREGQDFRDLYPEFVKNNAEIFGISRDNIQSHINFKEKHNLPFALLADTDQSLCKMFEVLDQYDTTNKDNCSMVRTTFLIDPMGKLIKEWRKVRIDGHAADVLNFITQQEDHEHNRNT